MLTIEFLIGALAMMTIVALGSYASGEVVFAPLRRAERAIGREFRFRLADLVVLVFHFQLAAAAMLMIVPRDNAPGRFVWIACAWVVVASWWVHGLALLAEAGAEKTPHRMLFLGFVGPLGYLGVLLLAPLVFTLITMAFIGLIVIATGEMGLLELRFTLIFGGMTLAAAILLTAAMGARVTSLWLVRSAREGVAG